MRIQHNIMAMNAYRNYTNNVAAMKKNLEKLSSGYKINRAGDDAAGLAISEKMRAQITGLQTAQKNAKDGISLVQTAEGALTEVHDMLNRMVELATQSANGTYDNTTDRYQMQKEVNQLLEEIDRIADSSNFNGINLLDGTLGLNTDAFSVSAGDAYTAAVGAATSAAALGTIHGGASTAFKNPSFTVDLKGLTFDNAGSGQVTLKIGSATLTSAKLSSTAGEAGATDIAAAFASAYTGSTATKSVTIGGLRFKVTTTGAGNLTFTHVKGATGTDAATEISTAAAKTFNDAIKGAEVKVTGAKDDTAYDHAIQDLEMAQAAVSGGLFGADWDLSGVVADGNSIVIGTRTFTFKMTAANSTITGTNTVKIDNRKFTTASQQTAEAIRLLSAKSDAKIHISAKDGNTIHVDMAGTAAQTANASTVEKFKNLFKVKTTAQDEKLASTKLTIDESKLKEGNVISVGDKKFVYKGSGSNGFTDAAGLAAKLNDAGYTTTVSTVSGKKVLNIQGKQAAGVEAKDVAAPTILGKGLTLQIGDTSEEWNQLNVAVQDMHAANLGIGNLKIDTEEAAQAAINKIKTAINTVSDVRGTLGATQNRLDHTINNLSVMTENIQDAESTIRDTDVAEEMMAYTKNNILIQSAQAMLAQANQVPQGVLQLLQ